MMTEDAKFALGF